MSAGNAEKANERAVQRSRKAYEAADELMDALQGIGAYIGLPGWGRLCRAARNAASLLRLYASEDTRVNRRAADAECTATMADMGRMTAALAAERAHPTP